MPGVAGGSAAGEHATRLGTPMTSSIADLLAAVERYP
jgi:hypothetical protein